MAYNWDITTETFIERAKLVHGDKYRYDKVSYVNKETKVEIICPIHGSFWQKPVLHLQKSFQCGCPMCAKETISNAIRLSEDTLKERIINKYGDIYDLSHIKYGKTGLEPVTIICKKHGPFEIKPTMTNRKTLCPTCSKDADKQRRFEHFISKARKIHGNKYDYSKVKFINGYTPVEIICHTHGIFTQRPNDHLSGKGCSKCYHESKKLKTDQFIKKAQKIWGERWDYSKTSCESRCNSLLTITCRKHGDFVQRADTHLAGNVGCIKCQRESGYFKSPRTKEDFIEAARKIHGNKFDYSLVDDTCGLNTTVKIICKKHGVFEQKVHNHLQGHGCRKCRNAQQEKIISIMLIKNNIAYEKEKMFKWLKRKGYLKLDFYLPEYNVAIEAQGAMHFGIHKNNKYKMEEEDYEDLFERDRLKYDLCKKHGIHILYFCYCKEWVPEDYIDKVYTTVSELMAAIKEYAASR